MPLRTGLRLFLRYSASLLKEAVVYVFVGLDLIGLGVTYFTNYHVPGWVLYNLPLAALFLGGFAIYRRGAADVTLTLDPAEAEFVFTGGGSVACTFAITVTGHLTNFGPQTGILQKVTDTISINGIEDDFILERMGIALEGTGLLLGKVSGHSIGLSSAPKEEIQLPHTISAGSIQPITLGIRLNFAGYHQPAIDEAAEWISTINITIDYVARLSDGTRKNRFRCDLDAAKLRDAVEYGKDFYKRLKASEATPTSARDRRSSFE